MSFHDITNENTEFAINGKKYTIEFNHTIISLMQSKYECKFFELANKIDEIRKGGIDEILEFSRFGFVKNHPKITVNELSQAQSYAELFDCVCTEYLRKAMMPDAFNKIVYQDEEKKKTAKKGLTSIICSILHLN